MSQHSATACAPGSKTRSAIARNAEHTTNTRRLTLFCAALLAAFALSCSSGGSSPSPAATVVPTPTAFDLGPGTPSADRVLEHIRVLSQEIGKRPSGSPAAQRAIDYAKQQFERSGYDVELQDFIASGPNVFLLTKIDVDRPEAPEIPAVVFQGSGAGHVSATLVDAGAGNPEEFPPEASGAIVLIQREDVTFTDMANNAQAAGAVAMVVANKEGGYFRGNIDPPGTLPAVAISQAGGQQLRDLLANGPLDVRVDVPDQIAGSNVIARPPAGACRTYSGGHLDSVPWAPGANDNASGSATVLELARAVAASGMTGHCFVLWGGEEIGLAGSTFFVAHLNDDERGRLEGYVNYDVVASNGVPLILGSSDLVDEAAALAGELGIDVQRGQLPKDVGSDHLSFLDGGLSSLMLTTPDFRLVHTPDDTVANLDTVYLQSILDLGFALLQAHRPAPAATPSP